MGKKKIVTEAIIPSADRNEGEEIEMLSQKGAIALAKRLQSYWHERGETAARFWAEPIGERFEKVGTYEIYRVNSNLVNGLPPRYLPPAAVCHQAMVKSGMAHA